MELLKINYINNNTFIDYLDKLENKIDIDIKLNYIKEVVDSNRISNIISNERLLILDNIAKKINSEKLSSNNLEELTNLIFICTHNSRRSQFCDVWFGIGLELFGKSQAYKSFSGGTEVVSCNENIINTLINTGFDILNTNQNYNELEKNIIYSLTYKSTKKELFSKIYSDIYNPQNNFFVVMVCSDADTNCPVVLNSKDRFYLPFEDPKYSDNLPECNEVYLQTSCLIALEMFYLVSKIK